MLKIYYNLKGQILHQIYIQCINVKCSFVRLRDHTNIKQHQKIIFCSLQNKKTSCGAHPANYIMGTGGSLPRVKVAGV